MELLITVCVYMSSVRRYGLDLLLVANVLPCVGPCHRLHGAGILELQVLFGHTNTMCQRNLTVCSIPMKEGQCVSQRVVSKCAVSNARLGFLEPRHTCWADF